MNRLLKRQNIWQKALQNAGEKFFTGRNLFLSLLAMSLVACNSVSVKDASIENHSKQSVQSNQDLKSSESSTAGSSEKTRQQELELPESQLESQLNGDLLYNLLAGEFAGVRGQMQKSIEYYSVAAEMSDDPQVIARAAYIALYSGKNELAIELTDRWLTLEQPTQMINRIRAMAWLHLQQLEPAAEAFDRLLLSQGEVNGPAVNSLTRILSKESSPEFALKLVNRLNQKKPDEPFLLLLLARLEASASQFEQAMAHTEQLIKLDPELADGYLIKAQILSSQGHQQQAVDAIAVAVEKRPVDTRLRMQYARMLVQVREFDKALEQFLEINKTRPDDENILLSLGLLSIETDHNDQAKVYLQQLLAKGSHNQQAHYYLGRIQQNEGDVEAAIKSYENVLDGDYWLDARIRVAALLARSGDTDGALLQLESLTSQEQTESNRIKVYLAKGQVLSSASRNREAYSLYNTALIQSPKNTDLLYARALTAEKLDLLDVTESDLKTVIKYEPDNASALNALGYTLADRTERLNEARDYIMKAAELLPDDPAILDSLGWVYYRLGEYENAIKWLRKAFEALKDAEIAAHLGEVLWVSGKTSEARAIWEKGTKLNGDQALLSDTIERLTR